MKPNRSIITALFAFLLIVGWFWYNSGNSSESRKPKPKLITQEKSLPSVVTRTISDQAHAAKTKLFGRTEASREVAVKAGTAGMVISTPISAGTHVKRGTIICRQDVNARQASLDQALAQLKSQEADFEAARKLVERGFASDSQLLTAQAALDAAKAGVKQAEIELENINIRAPFAGVYDQHMAEIGDYLAPGQPCGLLIELDPLKVSIDLTEAQLPLITQGQAAEIELATGETVSGKVKFIESRANPATRTFRAEISVANRNLSLKAGVTATVWITSDDVTAHLVPGQIMALNEDGEVGIKYLDFENRVRFAVTTTVDETADGLWVTGLPEGKATIIVKGQNFVAEGSEVEATDERSQ